MEYNKILAMREGVALVTSDSLLRIAALVGGKLYRVSDYRPLDGDGRQLRAENQYTIQELLPQARAEIDRLRIEAEKTPGGNNPNNDDSEAQKKLLELDNKYQSLYSDYFEAQNSIKRLTEELNAVKANKPQEPPRHKEFKRCLEYLKRGRHLYLYGPSGTGKSYIARQLAEELEVPFYMSAGVTDAIAQLIGYTDSRSKYVMTAFYKAWTGGGVFLFDEMDSSDSLSLNAINEALSNGYFSFPEEAGGCLKAHERFYCIGAGNTEGRGGDSEYTGRVALDLATLNRFKPIPFNYDKEVELYCAHGVAELVRFCHAYRRAVKECGISALCTYRNIRDLVELADIDEYLEDTLRYNLTGTLHSEEVRLISVKVSELMPEDNTWSLALSNLAKKLKAEEEEEEVI